MAQLLDVEYDEAMPEQEMPDRATAQRLRKDLAQAQEAHEVFRKQEHLARERADALSRVIKGLSVALDVIDPADKPMAADINTLADKIEKLDTSRYLNG